MISKPKKKKKSIKNPAKGVQIMELEEGELVSVLGFSGGYSSESGDYDLRGTISDGSDSN